MSRLSLVVSLCFIFFTSYTQVGYVKRFNGTSDWLEIAGKNSFGGAIDGGTMTLNRTSGNQNFQTYLFNRKGTSNTTLVAFRQDSAANSKSIGVLITRDSIKVIKRTNKAGVSTILSKYAAPTANAYWIRINRNGTGFSAFFSTSSPDATIPSWTLLNSTTGAFTGWADAYWKALGVASNSTALASSEFARSQNGAWLGTNTDTTTTTPTKPSCNCGFSLGTVAQVSNSTTGQFVFNSCNVSSLTWKLKATASSTVALATGTVTVTSSTVSFSIPSSMTTGTYYLEATANNCTGTDTKSFSYTIPTTTPASESFWVEYPNGQYIYDTDGSIVAEQLRLSLSGTQHNILNIVAPGFGCPTDRTASYSIDEGFYSTSGNTYGWIAGIPNAITLVPDGRVHTITVGCVGDIWGEGSNRGITNIAMQYFKVGGLSSTAITADPGLTYVQYPTTFQPNTTSLLRQTTTQFPDFSLPNKFNATLYGFPKSLSNFDLTKRGWKYWGYNTTITPTKRYWLDPDSWAGGAHNDVGILNDATAAQATSWGEILANSQGGIVRGQIVADGEWRGLQFFNAKGLNNSYYFWKKVREIMGNDAFVGEHQSAPYIIDARWNRGELSLSDLSIPMGDGVSASTVHNLNNHAQAQYWSDVPTVEDTDILNIPSGTRAGDFMDIVVNGYISNYNSTNAYSSLWSTYVNKKYWSNKKVQLVIEGFNEVSVYNDRFGQIIRSWKVNATKGAAIFELPPLSASSNENLTLIANFVGDGIQDWRSTGNQQETNPEFYHCNNPYRGCTNTGEYSSSGETYPTTWNGSQDYLTAGLYKMAQIPSDIIQTDKFFYEISLDNKATWITGIDLNPMNAEKLNRPTVVGMKNSSGTKHAILAVFQRNNPTLQYSFYIRHSSFGEKKITISGQFPELIIYQ